MAKSTTVVVPPKTAARLTSGGGAVSASGCPMIGAATWACGSTPPGTTILPLASTMLPASSPRLPASARATIFSPRTPMSH